MTTGTALLQEASAVANNDVVSLQITLPQMLDLALGTPEIGVVNFNILHNLLHVLLHQINLQTTKVEYRGEDANRVKTMVTSLKAEPALQLQEYSVTDATGKIAQPIRRDREMDIEVLAEDSELPTDLKVTKGVKHQLQPGKYDEAERVILVEPVVNGVPPTALAYKKLEQSVKQLQRQYQALEELATTPEIIERVKGRVTDPVTDVWQVININKRLDANKQGIDKLTTMIQDIIKGDISMAPPEDISLINARLKELEDKVFKIEQILTNAALPIVSNDRDITAADMDVVTATDMDVVTEATAEPATTDEMPDMDVITEETVAIDEAVVPSQEKKEMTKDIAEIVPNTNAVKRTTEIETPTKITAVDMPEREKQKQITIETVTTLQKDVTQIQQDLQDLNDKVAQIETSTKITPVDVSLERDEVNDIANLERCFEAVKNMETTHGEALENITHRVITLENEINNLLQKMDSVEIGRIEEIETDIEKLGQTMDRLLAEKEERETHINTLLAQIEILKTIKADQEDLKDALADKADTQTVNRKVSHDRFDAACDDLAHGLEEAIDKLSKQELIWQQALEEMQKEIASICQSKVDKIEMTPLKDFIYEKLKCLQEKLKIMAETRREIEAAGTKKQLRDVQCISCNKDVVMKREVSKFRIDPLPCTTSIKSYLTYELDKIRKQQRRLPHSRNMIQFEAAMQEEVKKMKTRKISKNHLCNRYCGGSHTITTPQQRVTRTGHFLNQCGPEVLQLALIRGKDGQMYRSRPMPGKLDVCGPTCESQSSEEILHPERIPVSTSTRKFLSTRRSSAESQKQNLKKSSLKEPEKYPKILEPAEKPIAEMRQTISPQENNNRPLPIPAAGSQDEIVYEMVK